MRAFRPPFKKTEVRKDQCHTRFFRFARHTPGDPKNSSLHDVSKPATIGQNSQSLQSFDLLDKPQQQHLLITDLSNPLRGFGGARRDRTDDLMLAKHALSQLSYGPGPARRAGRDQSPVISGARA